MNFVVCNPIFSCQTFFHAVRYNTPSFNKIASVLNRVPLIMEGVTDTIRVVSVNVVPAFCFGLEGLQFDVVFTNAIHSSGFPFWLVVSFTVPFNTRILPYNTCFATRIKNNVPGGFGTRFAQSGLARDLHTQGLARDLQCLVLARDLHTLISIDLLAFSRPLNGGVRTYFGGLLATYIGQAPQMGGYLVVGSSEQEVPPIPPEGRTWGFMCPRIRAGGFAAAAGRPC